MRNEAGCEIKREDGECGGAAILQGKCLGLTDLACGHGAEAEQAGLNALQLMVAAVADKHVSCGGDHGGGG